MTDKSGAFTALSQALKLEQDGYAFYIKASEETAEPKGQALFRSLADDELKHQEMVQRQLHALEGDGSYVLLPDLKATPVDLDAQIFPPDAKKIEEKVGFDAGEIQVLHVAIDNEIKSYNLHRQAAKDTHDADGKAMYTWLAAAEMMHFNLLMNNYESLVSLTGWV